MATKEQIIHEIVKTNYWWERKSVDERDALPYRRTVFHELWKEIEDKRILGIIGARRTGKTTIMYQLIESLIKHGIDPKRLILFSFDNPLLAGDDEIIPKILETYNEISPRKEKAYVFLDEVQYVKDWSRWLKISYDRKEQFKFIVSGSSGGLIYKDTSESLVGRISFHRIHPFSFYEFVDYHNSETGKFLSTLRNMEPKKLCSKTVRAKIEFYKRDIISHFNKYLLYGGLPEAFQQDLEQAQKWLKSDYIGLIFYKDLMKIFEIRDVRTLEELFFFTVNAHGQRINYSKLASALNTRIETVKQYLYYLEVVNIIRVINYYSKSIKKAMRAEKKIYIIDNGLRNAVLRYAEELLGDKEKISVVVEGIVCFHLIRKFSTEFSKNLYYWRALYEVDFIVDNKTELLPVEVKYSSSVDLKDLKGLSMFMERFKVKRGIVVTKDLLKIEDDVLYIPAWLFLGIY